MEYTLIHPTSINQAPENIFKVSILDDWNQSAQYSANWNTLLKNVQVKAYQENFAMMPI